MRFTSSNFVLTLLLFFSCGFLILVKISPPLLGAGDEAVRISDAISNASWTEFWSLISSKAFWLALHPPADMLWRIFSIAPLIAVLELDNSSIILFQKFLSFVFLTSALTLAVATLSPEKEKNKVLLLSLFLAPNLYVFQLGSVSSLTECTAAFVIYWAFYVSQRTGHWAPINSSILIALATQLRPEAILFSPIFALFFWRNFGFFKASFLFLLMNSLFAFRLVAKNLANGDISYFEFSSRYATDYQPILGSIRVLVERSNVGWTGYPIISAALILSTLLFALAYSRWRFSDSPSAGVFIFSGGFLLSFLALLLAGFVFGIGKPEPRNLIYVVPIAVAAFSVFLIQVSSLLRSNVSISALWIIIITISLTAGVRNFSEVNKEVSFHSNTRQDIEKASEYFSMEKGLFVDYLYFREWHIRALLIKPWSKHQFCSFSRCRQTSEIADLNRLGLSETDLENVPAQHAEFVGSSISFLQDRKPQFLMVLKDAEWRQFYQKHKQLNMVHFDIIKFLSGTLRGEKRLVFEFKSGESVTYQKVKTGSSFHLYQID